MWETFAGKVMWVFFFLRRGLERLDAALCRAAAVAAGGGKDVISSSKAFSRG